MLFNQKLFLSALACLVLSLPVRAQRDDHLLNDNWTFRFSHQVDKNSGRRVELPHTWNTTDALVGRADYKRGIGNYTRTLYVPASLKGRRLFLRFEGANAVTNVFVNGKMVGEHRGGYGAFVFEVTGAVRYGEKNTLLVRVNNGEQLDVMPLVGDFTFYGGIYRDVHLVTTPQVCISLLDYASPGVYLMQKAVSEDKADVTARVMLSSADTVATAATLRLQVLDGTKEIVSTEQPCTVSPKDDRQAVDLPFTIARPHLWNGTADPHMYRVLVSLVKDGEILDSISQPLGLRYYAVDPDKGFYLNGRHLQLHGVCRHQERAGVGNALLPEHHEEDAALMREMGVNAARLAHYPQATYFYDLMDKNGIVTWAEIPFVGPGGYADKGFVDQASFRENGKEQLREMIRQHYNHPAICFWGIFNELKETGDNPLDYVRELNDLAHKEDPTRPTTAATNTEARFNYVTDCIAWNRYDGWYGSSPKTLAAFLDQTHKKYPQLRLAISEYGAGASVLHQQDTLKQPTPNSYWHPENWQTEYHIQNWRILSQRPFVWGTFVWNMFDFGAAHRTEGDRDGINDKGLVSHDRKTRKDAFFFYKANWNDEPMVYIAGRRETQRTRQTTTVRVFSNCREVTLRVNGRVVGRVSPDSVSVCTFENVALQPGDNVIEAQGKGRNGTLTDTCRWTLKP